MEFIDSIKDKKVHIVGICGAETSAIARYLHKSGCNRLTLHDFNNENDFNNIFDVSHVSFNKEEREEILKETLEIPCTKHFKYDYLVDIMDADVIFVGQNWFNYDFNSPALFSAEEMGIPLYTITELYFALIPAPIIGVTGTNGKTTTSNLIKHILKDSGRRTYFSGNDRYSKQILENIDAIKKDDSVVLEISNRQLMALEASPHIAVITNIARDHIAEHGSFDCYIEVKKKLFSFQTEDDYAVINYDDEITRKFADDIKSKVFFYSVKEELQGNGAFIRDGAMYVVKDGEESKLIDIDELKIHGMHNVANALAASLAAVIAGISPYDVGASLKDFTGVKSRLELVREVSGIKFYNDISSTSPHATIAAINSFSSPVILIAGGMDKEMEFDELCQLIKEKVKKAILLPGTATNKMMEMLDNYEDADSIYEAVVKAYVTAEEGDTVVLSPAAANFFTMHIQGKVGYMRTVKRLQEKSGG
jgi:UDP-N-acetylmuramoylalanine--D-glutamate ligase